MKHIKIEKAKRLEESIAMFSSPNDDLVNEKWELQNEDSSKHNKSDEFVNAIKSLNESKKLILDILS